MQIQTGQNFQVPHNQAPRLIISLPVTFPSNNEQADEESSEEDDNDAEGEQEEAASDEGDDNGAEGEQGEAASDEGDDSLTEFSDGESIDELIDDLTGIIDDVIPDTSTSSPDPTTTTEDIISVVGTYAPAGAAVGFALVGTNVEGVSNKNTIFYNQGNDEIYIDTVGGVGNVPVAGAFYKDDCNPCAFISATGTLGATGGDAIGANWGALEWNICSQ